MNPFRVIITPEAQADIIRLDSRVRTRILNRLDWIGDNAQALRHEAMKGEEWKGCCKYRIGDYRIIYQLNVSGILLTVLKVGHRSDIYR